MDERLQPVWWALRIGLGSAALLAGLDKFFNLLANWEAYLSPLVTSLVPISAGALMRIFGVVEMAVGFSILLGLTRLGAYVAMAWLAAIAVNLLTTGQYLDIAVRDLEMAIAAFALARLTEVRSEALARQPRQLFEPSVA